MFLPLIILSMHQHNYLEENHVSNKLRLCDHTVGEYVEKSDLSGLSDEVSIVFIRVSSEILLRFDE